MNEIGSLDKKPSEERMRCAVQIAHLFTMNPGPFWSPHPNGPKSRGYNSCVLDRYAAIALILRSTPYWQFNLIHVINDLVGDLQSMEMLHHLRFPPLIVRLNHTIADHNHNPRHTSGKGCICFQWQNGEAKELGKAWNVMRCSQ
jgi:hypothetical protein